MSDIIMNDIDEARRTAEWFAQQLVWDGKPTSPEDLTDDAPP